MLRLNTAMGWGMPADAFFAATTHHDLASAPLEARDEALASLFAGLDPHGCEVEAGYRGRERRDAQEQRAQRVIEPRLLAKRSRFASAAEKAMMSRPRTLIVEEWGEGSSLLVQAADPDGHDAHVIFMPTAYHASRWRRHDDDIDHAMMGLEGMRDDTAGAAERDPTRGWTGATYLSFGHYPFTARVDRSGNALSATQALDLGPDETMPATPLEIRWLLVRHLGLLDDDGADTLRPVVARWWS